MLTRKYFAAVSLLIFWLFAGVTASAAKYTVDRKTTANGVEVNVISIKGIIDIQEWARWRSATSRIDVNLDTVVVLDSRGGAVPGGFFWINHIEEFLQEQEAHRHKVFAVVDGVCASMCVPVFYAFNQRYMTKPSKIGLHGVSVGGLANDFEQTDIYLQKMISKAEERNEPGFIQWLLEKKENSVFANQELTFLTGDQLISENSGMIGRDGSIDQYLDVR